MPEFEIKPNCNELLCVTSTIEKTIPAEKHLVRDVSVQIRNQDGPDSVLTLTREYLNRCLEHCCLWGTISHGSFYELKISTNHR